MNAATADIAIPLAMPEVGSLALVVLDVVLVEAFLATFLEIMVGRYLVQGQLSGILSPPGASLRPWLTSLTEAALLVVNAATALRTDGAGWALPWKAVPCGIRVICNSVIWLVTARHVSILLVVIQGALRSCALPTIKVAQACEIAVASLQLLRRFHCDFVSDDASDAKFSWAVPNHLIVQIPQDPCQVGHVHVSVLVLVPRLGPIHVKRPLPIAAAITVLLLLIQLF